jgi:hypothetical protein
MGYCRHPFWRCGPLDAAVRPCEGFCGRSSRLERACRDCTRRRGAGVLGQLGTAVCARGPCGRIVSRRHAADGCAAGSGRAARGVHSGQEARLCADRAWCLGDRIWIGCGTGVVAECRPCALPVCGRCLGLLHGRDAASAAGWIARCSDLGRRLHAALSAGLLRLARDRHRTGVRVRRRPAGIRAGYPHGHHFADALRQGRQHPRRIERRGLRRLVSGDDGADGDSNSRRMAAKTRLGGHCLDLGGCLHRKRRAAASVAPKNRKRNPSPAVLREQDR